MVRYEKIITELAADKKDLQSQILDLQAQIISLNSQPNPAETADKRLIVDLQNRISQLKITLMSFISET